MGLMTEEQAKALRESLDRNREWDHNQMPDEASALKILFKAYQRLKDFGWREIAYHPKDDTTFEVIEGGSTGIFKCKWQQTPARGSFWIQEDGGTPSHPVMFRRTHCQCGAHAWTPVDRPDFIDESGIWHRTWAECFHPVDGFVWSCPHGVFISEYVSECGSGCKRPGSSKADSSPPPPDTKSPGR